MGSIVLSVLATVVVEGCIQDVGDGPKLGEVEDAVVGGQLLRIDGRRDCLDCGFDAAKGGGQRLIRTRLGEIERSSQVESVVGLNEERGGRGCAEKGWDGRCQCKDDG